MSQFRLHQRSTSWKIYSKKISNPCHKFQGVPGYITWKESTEYNAGYCDGKFKAQMFTSITMSSHRIYYDSSYPLQNLNVILCLLDFHIHIIVLPTTEILYITCIEYHWDFLHLLLPRTVVSAVILTPFMVQGEVKALVSQLLGQKYSILDSECEAMK